MAGVAQSVEQLIRNEKVGGSIPLSGTRIKKPAMNCGLYFMCRSSGVTGCYVVRVHSGDTICGDLDAAAMGRAAVVTQRHTGG